MTVHDRRACWGIAAPILAFSGWVIAEVWLGDASFGLVRELLGLGAFRFERAMFELPLSAIAALAAGALGWDAWQTRSGRTSTHDAARRVFWLLAACIALALVLVRDPLLSRRGFDAGDEVAYVLGPKYFVELGHAGLYACAVAAQRELGQPPPRKIRDLGTNRVVRTREHVDARGEEHCRRRFSRERWQEFKRDVALFRSFHGGRRWEHHLRDHGYNATPVWTMLASPLLAVVPLTSASLALLSLLNPALVALALTCTIWAFGWYRGLCFATLFSVNYLDRYLLGDAYFRYAWITCLLVALCLWQRKWHALAGALLSVSAALTVFPVLLFAAPGLWAARSLLMERRLPAELLRFTGGAAAALVVLAVASCWNGLEAWEGFFAQMRLNAGRLSYMRVGLIYDFIWPKEVFVEDPQLPYGPRLDAFRSSWLAVGGYWSAIVALAGVVAIRARRIGPLSASVVLGFTLFFGVFSTVRYYYAGLVGLPLGLFAAKGDALDWRATCAALLALSAGAYVVAASTAPAFVANTYISLGFSVLLLWQAARLLVSRAPHNASDTC
jgi:hypothetical protein